MQTSTKRALVLAAILISAVTYYVSTLSPHAIIEKKIEAVLTAHGFEKVKLSVSQMGTHRIAFSKIEFAKNKINVTMENLAINATQLPYNELVRGNYSNITADWTLDVLTVSGIPYELPALAGEGKISTKSKEPLLVGELRDVAKTHRASFTVSNEEAILQAVQLVWQGATVRTKNVHISLIKKSPIHIPLSVEKLPLESLLAMMGSGKASGTGLVSGNVEVIVYPDGHWTLGKGVFSTAQAGFVQVSPELIPGDQPQMQIARTALSNFHYKELSLVTSMNPNGKTSIQLNLEGNNPEAFDGRAVKLHVNLSGDVLELLEQSLLPLADPTSMIEKETK